jgi:hypothetical protein
MQSHGMVPRPLWILLTITVSATALHSQRPFVQPELLSGEWETTTESGVHGIHLFITTYDGPQPQTIQIRVYHRQNGHENWIWWGDNGSVSPDFDGVRLVVRDLDVTFDSVSNRWTGVWVLDGASKAVVLERPTCQSHPLCGTWEGEGLWRFVRVHLVQSTDGILTAWMDRGQRHGEHLRVVSSEPSSLEVQTTNPGGFTIRFKGRLLDASTLEGNWNDRGPDANTRQRFQRVR